MLMLAGHLIPARRLKSPSLFVYDNDTPLGKNHTRMCDEPETPDGFTVRSVQPSHSGINLESQLAVLTVWEDLLQRHFYLFISYKDYYFFFDIFLGPMTAQRRNTRE